MYCGIIELIGLRDLAISDPNIYMVHVNNFHTVLQDCHEDHKEVFIKGERDSLFFSHNELDGVMRFLQDLRWDLLTENEIFCRGLVQKGELDITEIMDYEKYSTDNLHFRPYTKSETVLYGQLEGIKGICIRLEDTVVDELQKEEKLEKYVTRNYYLEEYRKKTFISFFDLKFADEQFIEGRDLIKLLKIFQKYSAYSKRLARFFIPIFNLCVLEWRYRDSKWIENRIEALREEKINQAISKFKETEKEERKIVSQEKKIRSIFEKKKFPIKEAFEKYDMEYLFLSNYFNKFKTVPGIQIIPLFFLVALKNNKLISFAKSSSDSTSPLSTDQAQYLLRSLANNSWLMNYFFDQAFSEVPRSLLNKKSIFEYYYLLEKAKETADSSSV